MKVIKKKLLSGNEAIARGAYEAGLKAAAAYPGTPSTEILENIANYDEIYCEWAPNEKVAVEVAVGASFAGARALSAMKHVGVNVAADPLFSFAYTGVNGGFVLVSADDPGMHSSQNEQDNRHYAKFMKIILLEPSDSQEAKDFTQQAFEISETMDMPVMIRTTTRISHSKGLVTLGERVEVPLKPYQKDIQKHVVMPAQARRLRVTLEERLQKAARFAESCSANKIEGNGKKFAVITSGIAYQYAREALGDEATYLKLGFTFPLPEKLIRDFVAQHETVYVIEEGEPFLEDQIKALGLKVIGQELFPKIGELSTKIIAQKLLSPAQSAADGFTAGAIPVRPPVLCSSCPHRGVFYAISKQDAIVTGDIGCYTLGVMPPLGALETCICMGASIGNAIGMSKMLPDKRLIAVIGDSTFLHSGVTGLMDAVYNKAKITVVILDNSITAMTGHQQNPATGLTIKGEPATAVELEAMVKACGVNNIFPVDAYQLADVEAALKNAAVCGETAVIIARQPCILIKKEKKAAHKINEECKLCKSCLKIGCPAIQNIDDKIIINETQCNGCALCAQMCKFDAIVKAGE
ncbi:MAG: indolepyruvate ferredoxin oxidoreductase subunit alpha [Sporomusaceae bacterium]|nr:indolepyruvate ferredoxin oxidoreductase subunit alpha [Sporomusaceae bacterium]